MIEINGNIVTWLSYKDNKLVKDPFTDLDYFKEKNRMERKRKTKMEIYNDLRNHSHRIRRYYNDLNKMGANIPMRTGKTNDDWLVQNVGLSYLNKVAHLDEMPKGYKGLTDLKKEIWLGSGLSNYKDTRFDEFKEVLNNINESEDYEFLKRTLINFQSEIKIKNVRLHLNGECDGYEESCNNIKVDYSNIRNTLLKYNFDVNFVPVRTINEYLIYVSDPQRGLINKKITEYLNSNEKNMLQKEVTHNMSRDNWYFDWNNNDVHAIMSVVLIIAMIESDKTFEYRRNTNGK